MVVVMSGNAGFPTVARGVPFDVAKLDRLLEEAGLDAVLATSPHSTRYLLGGYRFFLYDRLDPIGSSRYVPVVGYLPGRLDDGFYVGAGNEDWGTDVADLWVPSVLNVSWSSREAAQLAARELGRRLPSVTRVAVELPFLPADALQALVADLPAVEFVDASAVLDELRAVKTAEELDTMRRGSSMVVDAMLATFGALAAGATTREASELLRVEETRRGLTFDYCLVAAGSSFSRAPSSQVIGQGDVLSLDSGADLAGYTADLTRMGIAGEPTGRHGELLGEVDEVLQRVRGAVGAGAIGGELFSVARAAIDALPDAARMSFLAHGTGLLTHEAPRLTDSGSPPYPATHRDLPLEAGMVLSLECQVADPEHGFIKLEDTVFVTEDGFEAVGDDGRGWNGLGR
jgi:Xaa-Pro aminopeptidase